MTVKSTVLTKSSFSKQSFAGKKIIGTIQSGTPNGALPMYNAYMNVYTPSQSNTAQPLENLGFVSNTIDVGVVTGNSHASATLNDFNTTNVDVKFDGRTQMLSAQNCNLTFANVSFNGSVIEVSNINLGESTTETVFFAITYSCEQVSDHLHVVWAKLTIEMTSDPINSVQITWQLVSE